MKCLSPSLYTCNPSVSLYLRWASCRYVIESCFLFIYLFCLFGCPSSCSLWDLVPWPGIEPRPPVWNHRVLATGPLGKSQALFFNPFWQSLSIFFNLGHSCLKWLLIKLEYYLTYLLLFSFLLLLFIISIFVFYSFSAFYGFNWTFWMLCFLTISFILFSL